MKFEWTCPHCRACFANVNATARWCEDLIRNHKGLCMGAKQETPKPEIRPPYYRGEPFTHEAMMQALADRAVEICSMSSGSFAEWLDEDPDTRGRLVDEIANELAREAVIVWREANDG